MAMNEAKINHYLENIPNELIELTKGLDSKQKWAVYAALLENRKMFFNQIRDEFDANPSEVDRILKSLGESGLIIKKARNFSAVFNDNRTYYEPSLLGERFFDSAFSLIIPKKIKIQKQSEETKYPTAFEILPSPLTGVQIEKQASTFERQAITFKSVTAIKGCKIND
jgi:predicted transcriptional regulator